ncbi:DUF4382 domain-containing protein [Algoriphagus sp.]|uniref:DUF4382 domain-containing protein n=1 Tax=Algoriphagus sp. TaxID=1872435 RepID=UPI003F6F9731
MKKLRFYLLTCLFIVLFSACEDPDSSPKALLNVILVDSPAQWDSVFVEIEGVDIDVLVQGRETQAQTFYLEYKSGNKRIKVSELVGGTQLLLGRNELPIGLITSATIILGDNHSMFIGEKRYDLELSDPDDNRVSLPTSITLEQGISYDIILDIDLERSIVQTSETPLAYGLDPNFKLVEGKGLVELEGNLKPTSLYPAIYMWSATDTFSTHTNTSGNYIFKVPMDKYTLYFDPKNERYQDTTTLILDLTAVRDSVLEDITFKVKP